MTFPVRRTSCKINSLGHYFFCNIFSTHFYCILFFILFRLKFIKLTNTNHHLCSQVKHQFPPFRKRCTQQAFYPHLSNNDVTAYRKNSTRAQFRFFPLITGDSFRRRRHRRKLTTSNFRESFRVSPTWLFHPPSLPCARKDYYICRSI